MVSNLMVVLRIMAAVIAREACINRHEEETSTARVSEKLYNEIAAWAEDDFVVTGRMNLCWK